MRQALGTTWMFQLVLIFMLIFVGFLSLSINYSKAFKLKNEVVSMIEKYEGAKDGENGTVQLINNYLTYNNYTAQGKCNVGEYGSTNLNSVMLEKVTNPRTNYYYCIAKENIKTITFPKRSKYTVKLFFKLELPIIGDLFTFNVPGTTIEIKIPADSLDYYIKEGN